MNLPGQPSQKGRHVVSGYSTGYVDDCACGLWGTYIHVLVNTGL